MTDAVLENIVGTDMQARREIRMYGVAEDVRQALNRAKWILFEYCDTRG